MFRVVDLRSDVIRPEVQVEAGSPEEAARLALGAKLVRAGAKRHLACRVYWESHGILNMVRLYDVEEPGQTSTPRSDAPLSRLWGPRRSVKPPEL
jgi:hypothetical protein